MADIGDENNTVIVDENDEVIFDGVKNFGFALTASSTAASGFVRTRGIGFASSGSSVAAFDVERSRDIGLAANGNSSLAVDVERSRGIGFAISVEHVLIDENKETIEDENGTEILGFDPRGPKSTLKFGFGRIRDTGGFTSQSQSSLVAGKLYRRRGIGFATEPESEILAFMFKYGIVGGGASVTYSDVSGTSVTYSDVSGNTAAIYDDVLWR